MMRTMRAITKRELQSYFNGPIAYIVIVAFLLIAGWIFFSGLFLSGRADMRPFFAPSLFSPSALLVILVPALTMRLLAEEKKTGSIELLMTLPVRQVDVIVGKFLGAWVLLTVAFLGTCIYAITVACIGDLDWGATCAGYLGLVLFATALLGIGLLCSTLTKNQIIAFIFSFIISAFLYFVYWLQFYVPQHLALFFEYISLSFHLDRLSRGVIDSRDVIYYLSLTSGALWLATRSLLQQRGAYPIDYHIRTVLVVGSLVLCNIVAYHVSSRLDLTAQQQFTLSPATRATLAQLQEPVVVRAFFSNDLPPPYAGHARYVRDLLEEYYHIAPAFFRFEYIDPEAQDPQALGIPPVQVQVNAHDKLEIKRVYMGLAVSVGDKRDVIPVVLETNGLEYNFTTLLRKITQQKTHRIGFVTGHQGFEPDNHLQKATLALQSMYDIATVDINQKIPEDITALLVVAPITNFSAKEKKYLQQYLASGHNAAFFLPPLHVDVQTFQTTMVDADLNDVLKPYGLQVLPNLVLDHDNATINVLQQIGMMRVQQAANYPFFPTPKNFAASSVAQGLSQVMLPFTSTINVLDANNQILVQSSAKSWVVEKPFDLNPLQHFVLPEDRQTAQSGYALVATATREHSRVLVAGGAAFMTDVFFNKGNEALLLNSIDWLVHDDALLAIRVRGLAMQPLQELSERARRYLKYSNVMGIPLAFVIFGLLRWVRREERRADIARI